MDELAHSSSPRATPSEQLPRRRLPRAHASPAHLSMQNMGFSLLSLCDVSWRAFFASISCQASAIFSMISTSTCSNSGNVRVQRS